MPSSKANIPFKSFLNALKKGSGGDGEIKTSETIHKRITEGLQQLRHDKTYIATSFLQEIVELMNVNDTMCSRLNGPTFATLLDVFLQGESSRFKERGLYLLAKSLYNDGLNKSAESSEILRTKKVVVGRSCLDRVLHYFTNVKPKDLRMESYIRRSVGLLVIQLLDKCEENVQKFITTPESPKRKLGPLMVHGKDEILRVIYGQVIQTLRMSENPPELQDLWPVDEASNTYEGFPSSSQGGQPWISAFQNYIDQLYNSEKISDSDEHLFFSQIVSVPSEDIHITKTTICMVVNGCISIHGIRNPTVFDRFIDIPIELVRNLKAERSSLGEDDRVQEQPLDMIIEIRNDQQLSCYSNGYSIFTPEIRLTISTHWSVKNLAKAIRAAQKIQLDQLTRAENGRTKKTKISVATSPINVAAISAVDGTDSSPHILGLNSAGRLQRPQSIVIPKRKALGVSETFTNESDGDELYAASPVNKNLRRSGRITSEKTKNAENKIADANEDPYSLPVSQVADREMQSERVDKEGKNIVRTARTHENRTGDTARHQDTAQITIKSASRSAALSDKPEGSGIGPENIEWIARNEKVKAKQKKYSLNLKPKAPISTKAEALPLSSPIAPGNTKGNTTNTAATGRSVRRAHMTKGVAPPPSRSEGSKTASKTTKKKTASVRKSLSSPGSYGDDEDEHTVMPKPREKAKKDVSSQEYQPPVSHRSQRRAAANAKKRIKQMSSSDNEAEESEDAINSAVVIKADRKKARAPAIVAEVSPNGSLDVKGKGRAAPVPVEETQAASASSVPEDNGDIPEDDGFIYHSDHHGIPSASKYNDTVQKQNEFDVLENTFFEDAFGGVDALADQGVIQDKVVMNGSDASSHPLDGKQQWPILPQPQNKALSQVNGAKELVEDLPGNVDKSAQRTIEMGTALSRMLSAYEDNTQAVEDVNNYHNSRQDAAQNETAQGNMVAAEHPAIPPASKSPPKEAKNNEVLVIQRNSESSNRTRKIVEVQPESIANQSGGKAKSEPAHISTSAKEVGQASSAKRRSPDESEGNFKRARLENREVDDGNPVLQTPVQAGNTPSLAVLQPRSPTKPPPKNKMMSTPSTRRSPRLAARAPAKAAALQAGTTNVITLVDDQLARKTPLVGFGKKGPLNQGFLSLKARRSVEDQRSPPDETLTKEDENNHTFHQQRDFLAHGGQSHPIRSNRFIRRDVAGEESSSAPLSSSSSDLIHSHSQTRDVRVSESGSPILMNQKSSQLSDISRITRKLIADSRSDAYIDENPNQSGFEDGPNNLPHLPEDSGGAMFISNHKNQPSSPNMFVNEFKPHMKTHSGRYEEITSDQIVSPREGSLTPLPRETAYQRVTTFTKRLRAGRSERNSENDKPIAPAEHQQKITGVDWNDLDKTLIEDEVLAWETSREISDSSEDEGQSQSHPIIDEDARRAEDEWKAALKPHQKTMLDTLYQISNELLRFLIEPEEALDSIPKEYLYHGSRLLQELQKDHGHDMVNSQRDFDKLTSALANYYKNSYSYVSQKAKKAEKSSVLEMEKEWKQQQAYLQNLVRSKNIAVINRPQLGRSRH